MIEVRAELAAGRLRLSVDGHEQQAAEGVVCAAVSAITQTALLGLAEVARQHPHLVTITIEER